MEQTEQDNSGVRVPPPLVYVLVLVVGSALHFIYPVQYLTLGWVQLAVGLPITGVAGGLAIWAFRTMRRAETTFSVYESTTTIVSQEPYRFSRNPAYLSLAILYVGIALSVNALWILVLAPVTVAIITLIVIKREERYLEQKFGEEYLRYKARVRRWI